MGIFLIVVFFAGAFLGDFFTFFFTGVSSSNSTSESSLETLSTSDRSLFLLFFPAVLSRNASSPTSSSEFLFRSLSETSIFLWTSVGTGWINPPTGTLSETLTRGMDHDSVLFVLSTMIKKSVFLFPTFLGTKSLKSLGLKFRKLLARSTSDLREIDRKLQAPYRLKYTN